MYISTDARSHNSYSKACVCVREDGGCSRSILVNKLKKNIKVSELVAYELKRRVRGSISRNYTKKNTDRDLQQQWKESGIFYLVPFG